MAYRFLFYFLCCLVVLLSPFSAFAAGAQANHTNAKQAILLDYDTGMVLFEKNADDAMPTSSMSKVMSMYLVFEALHDGKLGLDVTLPVSEKAWRKGGSKMFVEVGSRVKTEDLIRGVIVQSGNDATIVLAEGIAGTEEAFAEALTAKAHELGMNNSQFKNASGWPDPEHYSTARDLAMLAHQTIANFPEYYHYYSETEFKYNNIKQSNRNPLLYRDIGADGMKTGHTDKGGYGLMASGVHNGRRVVLVVNGLANEKARAQEGARLLEWGLKGFGNVSLFTAGETVDYASVIMGATEQVALIIEEDINITVPVTVKNDLKVEMIYEGPLEAPVKKGQRVGTLRIDVPRLATIERSLVVAQDVEALGFLAGTFAKAKLLIGGGSSAE